MRPNRRAWRLTAVLAVILGGGSLLGLPAASPAAAAQPPGPAPGIAVSAAVNGTHQPRLFYVSPAGQVWTRDLSNPGDSPVNLGGRLLGGPSAVWIAPGGLFSAGAYAVFGRGTDSALWWRYQTASGWSPWAPLGGTLTSAPAAVAVGGQGASSLVLVYARGADSALWERTFSGVRGRNWQPWGSIGGRLLAGTGPAAAATSTGGFVAVTGTSGAIWAGIDLAGSRGTVWHSLGGRTTASPGITTAGDSTVVAFARGTDNAAWYDQFWWHPGNGVTSAWHSLGGRLTSAPTAIPTAVNVPQGPVYLFALGPDNQIWMRTGTWPGLRGWTPA